jgi:predicted nuclease of predicted toxin-antitoxin system|tara:strand:+ start:1539 stop:1907 length:369 start_codon:yes stop_codon:yes gene_type:complete
MKLLIDMNLSPEWVSVFQEVDIEAVHWSAIGNPKASDHEIMKWAKINGYIILTHDLDFGSILAATNTNFPSVIQFRTQNISPIHAAQFVLSMIKKFEHHLEKGALITVDENKSRVRILPLHN